ncbi:MAG TPA: class I SAM-dependent methyltransferase [Burkholderiaceae bacterium]|nr:class I SAM-dependent methyltransferase [Burkholderiaceae bacterium]
MSPDVYTEMARVQATHWWFVARREILRGQLCRLGLPPHAEILEVGSGTGANLDLLAEFGNVVAFEMAAEAIALAEARRGGNGHHITMRQGRCPEDLSSFAQQFDLICLFDVLEHIEQDSVSLARLATLLKPNGKLILTVPAYPWMWGPHDVEAHHKRRYTLQTLSAGCTNAGLSVLRVSHFNTVLFPLAVLGRMVEKLTGKKTAADRIPQAPINRLLKRIFALERHVLARMRLPFGLSLLLLAEPRPNA